MNYVRALLFVLLSLQLVFIGCNREESGPTAVVPVAGYQYKAYDLDGDVVATGTLNLSFEGAAITGQRDIKGAGLEAGSGAITGRVQSDNTIQIELNPGSAALVILEGKLEGDLLVGDRLLDTGDPPTPIKIGYFEAGPPGIGIR